MQHAAAAPAGFAAGRRVALVLTRAMEALGAGSLAGLSRAADSPLQKPQHQRAEPVQHPHCYLCTPLVRADCAVECVGGLLQWLRHGACAGLLELPWISLTVRSDAAAGALQRSRLTSWITGALRAAVAAGNHAATAREPPSRSAAAATAPPGKAPRRKRSPEHVQCAPETTSGAGSRILARRGKRLKGARGARSPARKRPALFTQIATAAFRSGRLLMLGLGLRR